MMSRIFVLRIAPLLLLAPLATGCDPSAPFSLPAQETTTPAAAEQPAPASLPTSAPSIGSGTVPANADSLIDDLVKAVNVEREKVGLPPVMLSESLSGIADSYATRLISADFFAHVDPYSGSTVSRRASRNGYAFYKVGENLAAGQKTVTAAMKDWMDSPTHRANILDPDFTEIGISIRDGGRYGRYWVQEFGRPLGQ